MFVSAGLPQVAFRSVGSTSFAVQPCKQPAWAPPHSVRTSTPPAATWSQARAPSVVGSSPIDLSVGGPPSQTPWSSAMDGEPLSSRLGPHHPPPPPPLVPIQPQGNFVVNIYLIVH